MFNTQGDNTIVGTYALYVPTMNGADGHTLRVSLHANRGCLVSCLYNMSLHITGFYIMAALMRSTM